MIASIGYIDWTILALSVVGISAAGAWFARRQRSTEQYFVGGRAVPGWAAGLSLFASSISTITFIAYPGNGYGGDWTLMLPNLTLPLVIIFVAYVVVPFYRQHVRMSAYEYLEQRFGYPARAYAAAIYLALNAFRLSFVLFLSAKAIATLTDWDLRTIILVSGAITIVYTALGGIDAVIWTDVLQSFVMIGGGVLCVILLLMAPDGGPLQAIQVAYDAGKFKLAHFEWDLVKPTILVMLLYGLCAQANSYITTQDSVQRYLATPSTRQAQRGLWLGTFSCLFIWTMFMFVGTLLWVYYRMHADQLPAGVAADQERVFPHFIMTHFPAGMVGLVLAAMVAAGMSTLSAVMNCLSMVTVCDFLNRIPAFHSDRHQLLLGKLTSCFWGIAGTGLALLMMNVTKALNFYYVVTSILCGGLLGIYMLAFLSRRANAVGVYAGLVATILIPAWGAIDRLVAFGLPVPAFIRAHPFPYHPCMVIVFANVAAFVIGYVVSVMVPDRSGRPALTIWDLRSAEPKREDLPRTESCPDAAG